MKDPLSESALESARKRHPEAALLQELRTEVLWLEQEGPTLPRTLCDKMFHGYFNKVQRES